MPAPALVPLPPQPGGPAVQIIAGQPALVLAPMQGITDAPMRALWEERGVFAFCVAEFLRISQAIPPPRVIEAHVPELAGCRQGRALAVQVQLLGGDAERLAGAAERAVQAGATAIDLNFGCPARTVNRHDGGAALLREPPRIRQIIAAVRGRLAGDIPVSAKLRLGWEDPTEIHVNAAMAEEGGASWITIHGRTRAQGYRPPAYWQPIGEVRRRLSIPVVANGDLWSLDDLRRCQDVTGCEHFMLGRSALADPHLPHHAAAALGLSALLPPAPGPVDWAALMGRLVALSPASPAAEGRPEGLAGRLKQWAKLAHERAPNGWYERIKTLRSSAEILAVLPGRPA